MNASPGVKIKAEQARIEPVTRAYRRLAALIEPAAVVTGEAYDGVLAQHGFIERAHDFSDHPVKLLDAVAIPPAIAAALKLSAGREGVMNVRCGEVENEVTASVTAHPVHGFLGQRGAALLLIVKRMRGLSAGHRGPENLFSPEGEYLHDRRI